MTATTISMLSTALDESVRSGAKLLPFFQAAGITTCAMMVSYHTTFAGTAPDPKAVDGLLTTVSKSPHPQGAKFPSKFTAAHMVRLIATCKRHMAAEVMAMQPKPPPAPAVPPQLTPTAAAAIATAAPTTAAAMAQEGFDQYAIAEQVHNVVYAASDRLRYEVVIKVCRGFKLGRPVTYGLDEFTKEYGARSAKEETFSFGGETYVAKDAATKSVKLDSKDTLLDQVAARAKLRAVAGAFSATAAAAARGSTQPADKAWAESVKKYVVKNTTFLSASEMDCFATVEGQMCEHTSLKTFAQRNPHVSLAGLQAVDAQVEARISDEMLRGHTADSAVQLACIKSPELYLSVTATPQGVTGADEPKGKGNTKRSGGPDERTEAAQLKSARNHIEQQSREIANLKGKGKGKGNGKGGGKGAWQQNGWQPQQQGWQPTGKGNGPPGGQPGVVPECRDYNYKVGGCTRGNACRFRHVCSTCGQAHPHKDNH